MGRGFGAGVRVAAGCETSTTLSMISGAEDPRAIKERLAIWYIYIYMCVCVNTWSQERRHGI